MVKPTIVLIEMQQDKGAFLDLGNETVDRHRLLNVMISNPKRGNKMTGHIQLSTTTESREDAEKIAEDVLEKRLAACVQIIGPITSLYRWKGKMEKEREWLCVMKTRAALYDSLEKAIKGLHPYEEPEILALPVTAGSRGYLDWLDKELK